jgi:hypothetical protein
MKWSGAIAFFHASFPSSGGIAGRDHAASELAGS